MKQTRKTILAIGVAATISFSIPGMLQPPFSGFEKTPVTSHDPTVSLGMEEVTENSRILARLHESVDMLDKEVEEVSERARQSYRGVKLIPVVITAYNPMSNQTDSTPTITASNKQVKAGIVALSRDIEEEFGFKFGDTVVIEGLGRFFFEDRMNKKWKRRVDIFLFSREASKKFGVRHSFLVVSD